MQTTSTQNEFQHKLVRFGMRKNALRSAEYPSVLQQPEAFFIAQRNHFKQGFTLIELLVVLSILAVLSSFTLPYLSFSPPTEEATILTELRDEISTYRAKALREGIGITLLITEESTAEVYEGKLYSQDALGEKQAQPKGSFDISPRLKIYSETGENAPHTFTLNPDGSSSVIQFILGKDVLSFNGAGTAPSIMPYDEVKP